MTLIRTAIIQNMAVIKILRYCKTNLRSISKSHTQYKHALHSRIAKH